jgi:hypothetical protein
VLAGVGGRGAGGDAICLALRQSTIFLSSPKFYGPLGHGNTLLCGTKTLAQKRKITVSLKLPSKTEGEFAG